MRMWKPLLSALVSLSLLAGAMDADAARRLGGGKSMGKQSSNVMQREATPSAPNAPSAPSNATSATPNKPAMNNAATPARKPWGAMLGGLAAGLGLAWLASSLGLGAGFANLLLIGLLVMAAVAVFAMFKRQRLQPSTGGMQPAPYAYAPASAPTPMPAPVQPPQGGSIIGSAIRDSSPSMAAPTARPWTIPSDFDTVGFLQSAKDAFTTLQAAWDKNDMRQLEAMMTDDLLHEVRQQLRERDAYSGGASNQTRVFALHAQLLGIEELDSEWMASVEFSGSIQEDAQQGVQAFREVWNMTKTKNGQTGWLLAGIQTLH